MNVQDMKTMLDHLVGHDILLTKREDGDIDKTIISLQSVSLVERGETIDGYVSPAALQLRGQGYVLQDNQKSPLPHQRYDIPLTDELNIRDDGDNMLLIETERANYAIARQ